MWAFCSHFGRFHRAISLHTGCVQIESTSGRCGKPLILTSLVLALTAFPAITAALEPAHDPSPADAATNVEPNVVLNWSRGDGADVHLIFFSSNFDDVNTGKLDAWRGTLHGAPYTYSTGPLSLGRTYYWKIEEIDEDPYPDEAAASEVWSFTVADRIVVDDMESYNDTNNLIWDTWIDGCGDINGAGGNGTGSCIFLEAATIHGGTKSMCYYYDNCETDHWLGPCDSEATRTFAEPQNWSDNSEKALVLWFQGDANNQISEMWAALSDDTNEAMSVYGALGDDRNDIKKEEWTDWNINLRDFSDAGVDLSHVVSTTIGFGERYSSEPFGGKGVVYFDDIGIYPRRCVPKYGLAADLSGNCIVDSPDIGRIAAEWLRDSNSTADVYIDRIVDFKDYTLLADSWLKKKLWPMP